MRFEELYVGWKAKRLTQAEAALVLGITDRSFRRYVNRYEEEGMDGLVDRRMERVSHRRAPVDEVCRLHEHYRKGFCGWNVKHYYSWYQKEGGQRSYSWVKNELQKKKLVMKKAHTGKHKKRRERSALPGMMVHQDGSTHQWIDGTYWDLIVTMDDATNEHYSMFFVGQEGTYSSFKGVQETIEKRGLFCSFYSDRGSHYWLTPEAGGKVDKVNLTQFGRAMKQLGIEMIAAYSPEARGRSERAFATHQGRLPQELKKAGITNMEEANRYLQETYLPAFNREFMLPAPESGSAFVPLLGCRLQDILCEQFERTVGKDNCVRFENIVLQIPQNQNRMHYVKAKVRVHRYLNGQLALFHGPRCLAHYTKKGDLITHPKQKLAA